MLGIAVWLLVTGGIGSRNRRQTECNQTCLNCRGAKEEKIQRILKKGPTKWEGPPGANSHIAILTYK